MRVLLLPPSEPGFRRDFLAGVGHYSGKHGPWVFHTLGARGWEFPPAKSLGEWDGDGVILPVTNQGMVDQLASVEACFVNITAWPGIPTVTNDNARIGRCGAEHLILQGYPQLAFVGIPGAIYARQRAEAFTACCVEHGLKAEIHEGKFDTRRDWDWDQVQQDLQSWLRSLQTPVGIMGCNDPRAHQVLEASRSLGLAVPGEVGVLGCDDDPELCELSHPTLSSVRLNAQKVGFEAARLLDEQMSGRRWSEPPQVLIPPGEVSCRQSTDDLHFGDEVVTTAVQYIRQHANAAVSVEEVAREACVSRPTLERRFRSAMGCTPFDEIRRARLEHVKHLLTETDWDLRRIAQASAFRDARTLGETFRKETGITPMVYRTQHSET